jgi:hypothetical protein
MARIEVLVRDVNTGRPLEGAYVSIDGRTAFTDASGRAVLDVPEGIRSIRVTRRGYSSASSVEALVEGSIVTVSLVPVVGLL